MDMNDGMHDDVWPEQVPKTDAELSSEKQLREQGWTTVWGPQPYFKPVQTYNDPRIIASATTQTSFQTEVSIPTPAK